MDRRPQHLRGQLMKRHAPGLYTQGDVAISRECDCTGDCDSRWVERPVLAWSDGYPVNFGDFGFTASTKSELLRLIAAHTREG
jgi:hypothetical protein